MKIRIEFEDDESRFDVVEFSSCCESPDDWAEVFMNIASCSWFDRSRIVAEMLDPIIQWSPKNIALLKETLDSLHDPTDPQTP